MTLRFSRRAVVYGIAFAALALLGMIGFAALLTGDYEILALAPLSILMWILVFVWAAAKLSRRPKEGDEG